MILIGRRQSGLEHFGRNVMMISNLIIVQLTLISAIILIDVQDCIMCTTELNLFKAIRLDFRSPFKAL